MFSTSKFVFVLILMCLAVASAVGNNPLDFTVTGCQITEPVYNYTFDFTSLHSELAHTITSDQGDIFDFNVCGNLSKTCDGNGNAAACLNRAGKQYVLGTTHELSYKNGKMYFSFLNGTQCKNGKTFQLHVMIGCDYTMDQKQLHLTPYADNECSFYMTWETARACLPEPDEVKSNVCSVKDPKSSHVFNLLPLSDFNYRMSDRNGSAFVINVCKPVLYGQNTMCPPGSSICRVDLSAKDYRQKFTDYGKVAPNPTIENDKLIMRHMSNIPCNSTHNFTSTIIFHCENRTLYGQPDYIGVKNCNHQFSWHTSLACETITPCVVTDPISGFVYDMSSLADKRFNLTLNDKVYHFGICSDAGSPCLDHAGSCESASINGQSTTLGQSNSNLLFNQTGSPYLLYEYGATCKTNTKTQRSKDSPISTPSTAISMSWSTRIEFVCASKGSQIPIGPKIIENSNCQLLIHYQTELACQEQITCKAKGYLVVDDDDDDDVELEIDLTPLISSGENYEAKVSDAIKDVATRKMKYFLNVCRPLVPKYGLGCPGGSAACMAIKGQSTPEDEMSLGYPDVSLTMINKSHAELKYLRGSDCPADKSTQLSSSIEFYCDKRAGKGEPVLQSIIDQCHYQFVWPTNVICATHLCKFNVDTCEIINEQLSESFRVRNANFADNGRITIKGQSQQQFSIDICGPDRQALSDYSQSTVKLFFNANGPCGLDGIINVELRLVCSAIEQHSSISDGNSCSLTYTQYTPEICKFLGLEVPRSSSTEPPTNSSNKKAVTIAAVTFSIILLLSFIVTSILFAVYDREQRQVFLSRCMRCTCFRRSTPSVRYSRVDATEEANLLLDDRAITQVSESDDDDPILS